MGAEAVLSSTGFLYAYGSSPTFTYTAGDQLTAYISYIDGIGDTFQFEDISVIIQVSS